MKVYVGSTNLVKVNAVKNIMEPLGFEVIGLDVKSLVSNQPKTLEETYLGARNRAMNLPSDGIRIGLEAGVYKIGDKLLLSNFGVLIDENNNEYISSGYQIELPKIIEDAIYTDGLELSDAMERHYNMIDIKHQGGAISYFTYGMVKRIEIFEAITKMLYGEYLRGKNKWKD